MSLALERLRLTDTTGPAGSSLAHRCLIENTETGNAVRYAYCLPRATKEYVVQQLEYAWNLPHRSLNLDTQYNMILLSATIQRLFNRTRSGWILLPEKRILKSYLVPGIIDVLMGDRFPVIDKHGSENVTIHRQREPLESDEHGDPAIPLQDDFDHYLYPYLKFPVIVSAVHPKYVIGSVASKLKMTRKHRNLNMTDAYFRHAVEFAMVERIWQGWTKNVVQSVEYKQWTNGKTANGDLKGSD